MRKLTKLAAGLLAAVVAASGSITTSAQTIGLPATVVDFVPQVQEMDYPVLDLKGRPKGNATWRVISGTGNCCENYVAATGQGRLYDFGGSYLKFSDDEGKTWKMVDTIEPLVNGEGTLTAAPNGDFVGMTWDPYSGDHALAFKYSAADESWYYNELILHQPFFDRPWMGVVQGPFEVAGQTFPYITVLESNFINDIWYYSLDGLNYIYAGKKNAEALAGDPVKSLFPRKRSADADYFQPQTEFGLTPLNGGGAFSADTGLFGEGVPNVILQPPELRWKPLDFGGGSLPEGRLLQDSRGYVHRFVGRSGEKRFRYAVSRDGGRRWQETTIKLPPNHTIEDLDYKAHGKLGITAISIHSHDAKEKDEEDDVDRDLLYRFKVGSEGAPRVTKLYQIGLGDANVGAGVGSNLRFDFATVAILPNGTIAASFIDSAHTDPRLAVLAD